MRAEAYTHLMQQVQQAGNEYRAASARYNSKRLQEATSYYPPLSLHMQALRDYKTLRNWHANWRNWPVGGEEAARNVRWIILKKALTAR